MAKKANDQYGASPLPKGKRKPGVPLFKKTTARDEQKAERDVTGQTDTSLRDMKQRLAEVPKKSAGSKHDKAAFEKKR
jgi:hypothetical protein